MKLGCCINMLGDANDVIGRRYIHNLKDAGYDYVELPLAQMMELSDLEFNDFLKTLERYELPCWCCNNFFPASVRLTGPQADLKRIETYIVQAVERVSRLGAKRIVFGSSGAKNVPEGFSHDEAFRQIVQVLQIADQYVKQQNIKIVIEPLNQQESNIILNLKDGIRLVEGTNRPNVRLLVDYYHFIMENESLEALQQAMPYICHVHFAEPKGRSFPREFKKEYAEFFDVLKKYGYTEGVSIEAYSQNPEQEIRNAIFISSYLK